MIDKAKLTETVENALTDTDAFIVDINVTPENTITVEIDSMTSVDIDTCVAITKCIESVFDRDEEDYELEVGSAGLTTPFKVKKQYLKNIGNDVEVLTRDGRKLHGILKEVADNGDSFTVAVPVKVKEPGMKRPEIREVPETFAVADVKSVKYLINFK